MLETQILKQHNFPEYQESQGTLPLPPQAEASGGVQHIQCKTHLGFKNPDSIIP